MYITSHAISHVAAGNAASATATHRSKRTTSSPSDMRRAEAEHSSSAASSRPSRLHLLPVEDVRLLSEPRGCAKGTPPQASSDCSDRRLVVCDGLMQQYAVARHIEPRLSMWDWAVVVTGRAQRRDAPSTSQRSERASCTERASGRSSAHAARDGERASVAAHEDVVTHAPAEGSLEGSLPRPRCTNASFELLASCLSTSLVHTKGF